MLVRYGVQGYRQQAYAGASNVPKKADPARVPRFVPPKFGLATKDTLCTDPSKLSSVSLTLLASDADRRARNVSGRRVSNQIVAPGPASLSCSVHKIIKHLAPLGRASVAIPSTIGNDSLVI